MICIDLLQPARSPTNHIVMEERTINEIHRHFVVHHHLTTTPTGPTTSTVASSNFTLAAIFCRITSSPQVAGSFKLIPPDGAPQVDSWARTAALAAMWMEFHKMAARFDQRLPTPQNPFVLGYILTQKVRSSIDLGTNDRPASMTPAYFVPQECYLSTTAVPGDLFTSGTLNFCILTGSPKPNAYKSPPFIDPKSNHLDKTFFSELSLYGGPSGKGAKRPSGHDGIMAFSKRVFYYNWLQESLLSKLLIQPELYGQIVDYPVGQNNGFGNKKTSRTWEGNNNQFSRWATDFEVRTSSTSGLKVEGEGKQYPIDLLLSLFIH